jgi:hypothetical protein
MFGPRTFCQTAWGDFGLREVWTKITNFAGLTSSQGKTIFSLPHKPIVVINSVTYDWDGCRFVQRKYVPLGIMLNKPRSGLSGLSTERSYGALGALHRELREMSPAAIWPAVSLAFIDSVRPILQRCPNIPWYTPEFLGGPGLIPKENKKGTPKVSEHDRKLFSLMLSWLDDPDQRIRPTREKTVMEWKFHDYVCDEYERLNVKRTRYLRTRYQDEDVNLDDEGSTFYRLKVVESLFTQPMDQLYEPKSKVGEDKPDRAGRVNSRFHEAVNKYLNRSNPRVKMFTWEEILERTEISEFPVVGSCVFDTVDDTEYLAEVSTAQPEILDRVSTMACYLPPERLIQALRWLKKERAKETILVC